MGDSVNKRRGKHTWSIEQVNKSVGVAARSSVAYHGNTDNRMTPESGNIEQDDFTTTTLIWSGKYSALFAVQPSKGDVYLDYAGLAVQRSVLTPSRGDMATLTVVLSNRVEADAETSTAYKTRWEIDWTQIEKELVQHPYIADDANAASIIEDVELWRNSEIKLRAAYKYVDTDEAEKELDGKALEVAQKMQRGQTGYLIFAPAIRRVRDYQGRPSDTGTCGKIETPEINVAGYVYLKTADRLVQQADDVWQRTEEWTGADAWDADLYTTDSGWNASGE